MLDGKTDRGGEQGGTNGLKGKHKVFKSHKYSNGINNDGKVVLENFCKAEASETTGEKGRLKEVDRTGEEGLLLGTTKTHTHTQRERERERVAQVQGTYGSTGTKWSERCADIFLDIVMLWMLAVPADVRAKIESRCHKDTRSSMRSHDAGRNWAYLATALANCM